MRYTTALRAVAALVATLSVSMTGAQGAAPPITDFKAGATALRVTGEITAIDSAKRLVTIKGPEGRTRVVAAGPKVRNFDQVKVGDKVEVDYEAAIAIALLKGQVGREKIETDVAARAPAGGKPGVAAAHTTTIVARIENVDYKRSVATLQGPEGRYVVVKVKDPKVLKELKAGDDVVIGFYEAAAVAVRPAKS